MIPGFSILLVILGLLVMVLLVVLIRTFNCRPSSSQSESIEAPSGNYTRAQQHLSEAVRFHTVSYPDRHKTDWSAFRAFHDWLEASYPLVHEHLTCETVSDYTLLYIWEGSDPKAKPVLLTAHQDVVPAGDPQLWEHPPFSGDIADRYIWGRGTLDVKIQIVALMEAIESLIASGMVPTRSVHLCFGHDEEIGGTNGAAEAAKLLAERQIGYSLILDEGGAVTTGMLPGITKPIATFGAAEKGYLDLELYSTETGGHASMPGPSTALQTASAALQAMCAHPFRAKLTPVVRRLFDALCPHLPFPQRLIAANLWLFSPVFIKALQKAPSVNAMLRTTIAPTMAFGSEAANQLPEKAGFIVNVRILQGEDENSVLEHVQQSIRHVDAELLVHRYEPPSNVSSLEGEATRWLTDSIASIFPGAVVAPYLMAGSTDARKYEKLSPYIYRFSPLKLDREELNRMHGSNERISLENVNSSVHFYTDLIKRVQTHP
ncbi:MAG: M20/M25/M40 family metallo-hydrolase [Spirochaetota bacterium]